MHKQANAAIRKSQSVTMGKRTRVLDGATTNSINLFDYILASKSLTEKEKEETRIAQEGFAVLVAGVETTAQVLTGATFHILANKTTVLPKLKEELSAVMTHVETQVDVKTLEQLPWLVSPFSLKTNGRTYQ